MSTGKVFVREWARLRYGVFEEHGYTGEVTSFPMFYRSSSAAQNNKEPLVPNVCSAAEVGDFGIDYGCHIDPQTGLYDSDCSYTLMDRFKPSSSIMSDTRILSSVCFFVWESEHASSLLITFTYLAVFLGCTLL